MNKEKLQEKYVLWLPSWYPNLTNSMTGDFIQRHAEAVALNEKIHLLYVVRDATGAITKSIVKKTQIKGFLKETIIYYYIKPLGILSFDRLVSYLRAKKIYKSEIRALFKRKGLPSLVHVHVAYRAGLIALWVRAKWNLPYVITEHWTAYLKESDTSFEKLPLYLKGQVRRIFKSARCVSVVSAYLGARLKELFNLPRYEVIPNVVNTELFYPFFSSANDVVRFVHISVLNYQKDPENMLKAFSIVRRKYSNFQLTVIGPEFQKMKDLAATLGLKEHVRFTGEMTHSAVSEQMRNADALVLYSRFETFGCVLIEANACGLPVIVSDIPVFHENIKEGFNGVFAKKEDPEDLAEKIALFIEDHSVFDMAAIANHTKESYNYPSVGKAFVDWYKYCQLR